MGNETPEKEPQPGAVYSLESIVRLTGVSRSDVMVYCKSGLLLPLSGESENPIFDDEAVFRIRRIEHLRSEQGINLTGIRMIFDLLNEVRRLEDEMRFHRW